MPAERYFFNGSLQSNQTIELQGPEFHHLVHVMRMRKGENVEIVNGQGSLAQGNIEHLGKEKANVRIDEVHLTPKLLPRLILAQALPKPNRLDFIIEKGTELGVDAFWFFPGEHSVKKECYPSQMERIRTLTIAAMKQSGRLYLPSIDYKPSLVNWTDLNDKTMFYGDLDSHAPLFEETWKRLPTMTFPVIFVTGPEGGLSEKEEKWLKENGGKGVKLHPNILRTETASIMAISLMSHWLLLSD